MTKKRLLEDANIGVENLDISKWPQVFVDMLSPEDQQIFLRRKLAVEMYMKDESTLRKIEETTGIRRKELHSFIRRCFQFDENGIIWGFRALIPQKRLTNYQRTELLVPNDINIKPKLTGAFQLLLDTHPSIKETIDTLYLGRNKRSAAEPVIRVKHLHRKFLEACREAGIKVTEYPFITQDKGKRALERYVKKLESNNFAEAAKRYGEDAASVAGSTGTGNQNHPMIIRPFERVQFDGHRIDAIFTITFHTPEGDEIVEVLNRIWLLLLIDVATRVVLGYHISYNSEYSASDVLQCVRNSIVPWQPKQLTIPGLKYPEKIGFASGLIKETEWGLWDELYFDNGKANLANMVRERLTHTIGCAVNAGPIKMPVRRSIIERFFQTLEENGFHRFPSTTGSHPRDPRRRDPEKKAKQFFISAEHLEELTEILIANYNLTPHEGINNMAPLEVMQQRVLKGYDIRQLPPERQNEIIFLYLHARRKVKGNIKTGQRPYIQFENAIYRNDVLSHTPDLIGTELDLLVNIEDLRVIRAFLSDGSEFGVLTANGRWGITPHSLQVRKQINKLRREKLIHFTSYDDPIEIYQRYLESQAKKSKKDRSRLQQFYKEREKQDNNTVSSTVPSIEEDHADVESITTSSLPKITKVQSPNSDPQIKNRKFKKTIIY